MAYDLAKAAVSNAAGMQLKVNSAGRYQQVQPHRRCDDLAGKTLQPVRKELKCDRVGRPFCRGIVNDS